MTVLSCNRGCQSGTPILCLLGAACRITTLPSPQPPVSWHSPANWGQSGLLSFGVKVEGCKMPWEPPRVPDRQAKLAEWKQAEDSCKCGCERQGNPGLGKRHSSFLLGRGVAVLSEPGAEWQDLVLRNVTVNPSMGWGGLGWSEGALLQWRNAQQPSTVCKGHRELMLQTIQIRRNRTRRDRRACLRHSGNHQDSG